MKQPNRSSKILSISPCGLIHDPDVRGPRFRKDVIDMPADFEQRDMLNGKRTGHKTDQAIRWIAQFPSLQLKFAEIAYRRIDLLETSLWFDHTLSKAARNQFKFELMQLESDAFPIWQNAIQSTRQYVGKLINLEVHGWMNEPVNFSETSFFTPDWKGQPYSNQAASAHLKHLSFSAKEALQISLENYTHNNTNQKYKFYKLNQSIQDANTQSRLLGLNLVFQEF